MGIPPWKRKRHNTWPAGHISQHGLKQSPMRKKVMDCERSHMPLLESARTCRIHWWWLKGHLLVSFVGDHKSEQKESGTCMWSMESFLKKISHHLENMPTPQRENICKKEPCEEWHSNTPPAKDLASQATDYRQGGPKGRVPAAWVTKNRQSGPAGRTHTSQANESTTNNTEVILLLKPSWWILGSSHVLICVNWAKRLNCNQLCTYAA